jgi:hypothetical protein
MVVKRTLRAVSADEKPAAPTRPKTVTEAAKTGTTRELLSSTRYRIAVAVEDPNTPARDLAALSKRLMETVREIEAIDARTEESESHAYVTDGQFEASAI